MYVIKRDNSEELFQVEKIENAIKKAFESCNKEPDTSIVECVISNYDIESNNKVHVEEIQDSVEKCLMESHKDVAKSYIIYRYNHKLIRENKDKLYKDITKKLMASDVQNQNANLDEHSFGGRMGEVNRLVLKDYALKYCMSRKSRNNHLNNEIYIHDLDSYAAGMHNCISIPFDELLSKGFNTRQTDVRPANSINTAMQLVAVIFQLQSLQQFGGVSATHLDWTMVPYVRKSFFKHFNNGSKYIDCDGFDAKNYNDGMSVVDELYLKFDKLYKYAIEQTEKELYQSVEGMYHNLNTLQSRSGNQLPFTSINYGTCTLPEGRMVTKALIEGSIHGVGKYHRTPIFPCGIFQMKKGVNTQEGDQNYDLFRLALKSTSQRLYPNYANADWTNNTNALLQDRKQKQEYIDSLLAVDYNELYGRISENPTICLEKLGLYNDVNDGATIKVDMSERPIELFNTMGCRTVNLLDINALDDFKRNVQCVIEGRYNDIDDVFSAIQKDGRGNICPVTIIMPTLAMQAKEKIEERAKNEDREYTNNEVVSQFMKILAKKIEEAKDMLIERFEWICSQSPASANFMWENNTMAGYLPEEGIRSALRHGTLVIGQIGLAETLQILIQKDQTTEDGMCIAKDIENLFNDKCKQYKETYKLNFGVYYTPAENLCYTAMNKFKDKYGVIKNVSDREYFTNSIHVPVWIDMNPFDKIDIESQLTGYSNAGCITYVELPSTTKNNIDALENIVKYAMDKNIPYFAVNIPVDNCECGYSDEIGETCPMCGSKKIQRLRRVTGYLTGSYLEAFNKGKIAEVRDRVKHIKEFD